MYNLQTRFKIMKRSFRYIYQRSKYIFYYFIQSNSLIGNCERRLKLIQTSPKIVLLSNTFNKPFIGSDIILSDFIPDADDNTILFDVYFQITAL